MSNTNIDNKVLEKFGEFVKETKERGNITGLTMCDEFGVPLDGNHYPGAFYPVSCEDTHNVVDAIQNGDVDCSFNVDLSFRNHWDEAVENAFPDNEREEFTSDSEINYKHIDLPVAAIAGISPAGRIDAYYPTIGGMEAVIGGIEFNHSPITKIDISNRGIEIESARYSVGYKENILDLDKAVVESQSSGNNFNLRDHAHAFMLQKDKHKLNFKTYLNSVFRKNEKALKDKFIKDLYGTKILYKDYKHLNFATKRLILNNRLRANIIKYCSGMEIAATDILVLLENDSTIQDYLFKNLPVAIRKMIDRGIEL